VIKPSSSCESREICDLVRSSVRSSDCWDSSSQPQQSVEVEPLLTMSAADAT